MHVAVIENHIVTDVIVAGPNYRHPQGKLLVPTEHGAIGDSYNGRVFIKPAASRDQLMAHAYRRSGNIGSIVVVIPAVGGKPPVRVIVGTGGMSESNVARIAQRAEKNPDFVMPMPQPHGHKTVMLIGNQFILLHEKITDWHMQHYRAFDSLKNGVKSGLISSHGQIDNPPSNILAWPPRYQDLSTEERAKEDFSVVS